MKKCVCMILSLAFGVLAALGVCEGYTEAFMRVRPGYSMVEQKVCSPTAAAIMEGEGKKVLLVAELVDGEWQVVIDNENALDPNQTYRLLLDSDNVIYWMHTTEFNDLAEFRCDRGKDGWGDVSLRRVNAFDGGSTDLLYDYRDGALRITRYDCDENDNVLSTCEQMSIPGAWMEDALRLDRFDIDQMPYGHLEMWEWPGDYALSRAAEALMPGYTYVDGLAFDDCLRMVLRRPDGRQVFVGATEDESGYHVAESAPLPEGVKAYIGYENWESMLWFSVEGREKVVELSPFADGTWGASHLTDSTLSSGKNWISGSYARRIYGDHPWSDITTIDWRSLPHSEEELYARADTSGWATPNNPNLEDRLHLRTKPDKSAHSLGKYYNGTPVRVLGQAGDFTHVSICGVEGYMMTKFLAFGDDVENVSWAANTYYKREEEVLLWDEPGGVVTAKRYEDPTVIGVVGDDWYHVWYPNTGLSGYVPQDSVWPGNG